MVGQDESTWELVCLAADPPPGGAGEPCPCEAGLICGASGTCAAGDPTGTACDELGDDTCAGLCDGGARRDFCGSG